MHQNLRSENIIVQSRDRSLIRMLAQDFRILDRNQIEELFPMGSTTRLNFRLKKLRDAGYLSTRPVAFPGSRVKLGYYLGPRAQELFDPTERNAVAAVRSHAASLAPSDLNHRMLVDSVHIRFLTAARDYPNYKLVTWVDQYSPWWEGLREYGVPFQSDAYVEYLVLMYFDSLFTFFLEVDRGTERGQIIKDKIGQYGDFAATKTHQQQFATSRPFRVLFITTTPQRIRSLSKQMASQDPNPFWLATAHDFSNAKLFDAYWVRPGQTGSHSLLSHE